MPISIVPVESKQMKKYKSRAGAIQYGSTIAAKKQFYSNPTYKKYQQPRAANIVEPASWSKKA